MSSYLHIELDTTSPIIEIYAPRYTTKNVTNTIIIEANESLSDFQDIYIIDGNNIRHNYTFVREGNNKFTGRIKFSDYPVGMVTIYAKVRDVVDNISNLATFTIELKESIPLLKIKDDIYLNNILAKVDSCRLETSESIMVINSSIDGR